MKASLSISGEIVLEKLLKRIEAGKLELHHDAIRRKDIIHDLSFHTLHD